MLSPQNCVFLNLGAAVPVEVPVKPTVVGNSFSCSRLGQKAMHSSLPALQLLLRKAFPGKPLSVVPVSTHNHHWFTDAEEVLGYVLSWIQFKVWTCVWWNKLGWLTEGKLQDGLSTERGMAWSSDDRQPGSQTEAAPTFSNPLLLHRLLSGIWCSWRAASSQERRL